MLDMEVKYLMRIYLFFELGICFALNECSI